MSMEDTVSKITNRAELRVRRFSSKVDKVAAKELLSAIKKEIGKHDLHRHVIHICAGNGTAFLVIGRLIFDTADSSSLDTLRRSTSHGTYPRRFKLIKTLERIDAVLRVSEYSYLLNDKKL